MTQPVRIAYWVHETCQGVRTGTSYGEYTRAEALALVHRYRAQRGVYGAMGYDWVIEKINREE